MATSVYPNMGGAVDNTSAAKFIPEIWSDEVIAAYKSNLVLANLVKKMSMTGKKGDTIHVPKPTRGSAHAKAEGVAVTIQNNVESEVLININKHFEFSRLIEDITEVQALASLRQFYTGDAGYGLAKQVDDDPARILACCRQFRDPALLGGGQIRRQGLCPRGQGLEILSVANAVDHSLGQGRLLGVFCSENGPADRSTGPAS